MGHKCFISFKAEDKAWKEYIQENLDIEMIDKSLDDPIDSDDEDYIMTCIRRDYLSDSTVTIHLIGKKSAENLGWEEQKFIKKELRASLFDGKNSPRSGILGVVLPDMCGQIFQGQKVCASCNANHNIVDVADSTVVKEFSYNYYIPNNKCAHAEEDRYCVIVKWEDFCKDPEHYIDLAYEKRGAPIASKVKVRGGD